MVAGVLDDHCRFLIAELLLAEQGKIVVWKPLRHCSALEIIKVNFENVKDRLCLVVEKAN